MHLKDTTFPALWIEPSPVGSSITPAMMASLICRPAKQLPRSLYRRMTSPFASPGRWRHRGSSARPPDLLSCGIDWQCRDQAGCADDSAADWIPGAMGNASLSPLATHRGRTICDPHSRSCRRTQWFPSKPILPLGVLSGYRWSRRNCSKRNSASGS